MSTVISNRTPYSVKDNIATVNNLRGLNWNNITDGHLIKKKDTTNAEDAHIEISTTDTTNSLIFKDGQNNAQGYIDTDANGIRIHTVTDNQDRGLFIGENGRIGINVAEPEEDVEIDGNLQLDTGGAQRSKIIFYDKQNDHEHSEIDGLGEGTNGGNLAFYTKVDGGTVTEKMRITADGNVGINTTTPGYKLEVNGTTNISGALTTNGITNTGNITTDTINITSGGSTNININDLNDVSITSPGTGDILAYNFLTQEWNNTNNLVITKTTTNTLTVNTSASIPDIDMDNGSITNVSSISGNSFFPLTVTGQITDISNHDTDDLQEGLTNLYYTDARARGALIGGTGVSYNPSTGNIEIGQDVGETDDVTFNSVTADVIGQVSDISNHDTDDLAEGLTNQYFTQARARASISVDDDGGDGSLSYNSTTGVITYGGPSPAEVRAHFSGGTGVTYNSGTGQISIGQDVSTTSTVTFLQVTAGLTGNVTGQVSDISNHDTDDLTEGPTNQYFTQARARQSISVTDAGGDGSLSYNNTSGVITYTGPSASEVRAHFSGATGVTYSASSGQIAIGQDVSTTADVTFNTVTADVTGQVSDISNHDTDDLQEGLTNQYFTQARARQSISVTDAGGDGSLSYNNTSGVITYTGPSASEVRAHFTEGTGVTITNGEISIGQDVSTTADVTFNKVTADVEANICDINQLGALSPATQITLYNNLVSNGTQNISANQGNMDAQIITANDKFVSSKGEIDEIEGDNINLVDTTSVGSGRIRVDGIEGDGTVLKLYATKDQNAHLAIESDGITAKDALGATTTLQIGSAINVNNQNVSIGTGDFSGADMTLTGTATAAGFTTTGTVLGGALNLQSGGTTNIELGDLNNVDTSGTLQNGDIIRYNTTNSTWESQALSVGLDDLNDVIITSPQTDEVLQYNNLAQQWVNTDELSIRTIDATGDITTLGDNTADTFLGSALYLSRGTNPGVNDISIGNTASTTRRRINMYTNQTSLILGQIDTTTRYGVSNANYLTAQSLPIAVGTETAHSLYLGTNNVARQEINSSGAIAFNGSFGTTGQVLQTNGSFSPPTWVDQSATIPNPIEFDVSGTTQAEIEVTEDTEGGGNFKISVREGDPGTLEERFTINELGAIAVNGNFGTGNQILTTFGSNQPPNWSSTAFLTKVTANSFESTNSTRNYLHQESGEFMLDSEAFSNYKEVRMRAWINPDESAATGAGSTTGTRNEILKARLYNTSISYLAFFSKDFNWLIHNSNGNNLTLQGSQVKAQKDLRFYSESGREQNIKTGFERNSLSGNSTWHTIKTFTFNQTSSSQWNMGSVEVHWTVKQVNFGQPHGRGRAYDDFYLNGGTFYGGTLSKTDTKGSNSQVGFRITRSGSTLLIQYRCTNSNTTSVSGTIEMIGSNFNFYT